MMLFVDMQSTSRLVRVRLAHTETATRAEIIERAREHYVGTDLGVSMVRADDMSGPKIFEVATVSFWID